MEKKSFKKYFTQGKALFFIGIAVAVIGVLLYGINYFFVHEWDLWQGSVLTAVAGIVVIICHFSIRVRDGAVDEYARSFHKIPEQELNALLQESERRPLKVFEFTSGAYALNDTTAEKITVGNDSTPRCEKYACVALLYTPESFYAVKGNLDLITGDVKTEKVFFPLADIESIEVLDNSFTKEIKGKNKYFECFSLEIKADGVTHSFTVHNDALTDEAVEKIRRAAESKRQS